MDVISLYDAVAWATRAGLVAIAALALLIFVQRPTPAQRDIALMLGSLGLGIVAGPVLSLIGPLPHPLDILGSLLIMAHPYLLLRLVERFVSGPAAARWGALMGMLVSMGVVALIPAPLPLPAMAPVVAYFALVEGYAAIQLIRGASERSGIVRRRMVLAAGGSAGLGAAVLLAGVATAAPAAASITGPATQLVALGAVVAYYFAFATPRWLRDLWRLRELDRFLGQINGLAGQGRDEAILQEACTSATRATGALGSAVMLRAGATGTLVPQAADHPKLLSARLSDSAGATGLALREGAAIRAPSVEEMAPEETRVSSELGARSLLAAPIKGTTQTWGVLAVFLRESAAFGTDDLEFLERLSVSCAITLDRAALLRREREVGDELEAINSQLEAGQARFEALLKTAPDGIISADQSGRILLMNQAAEEMFGYSAQDATGQPLTLLMPERFQRMHRDGLDRFLSTGEARVVGRTVELVGRRRDGIEFPIELSLAHWKAGSEDYFTAVVRDITERKRAEEDRHRLAAIVESSDDAIVGLTLEGVITSWNAGAQRLYGYAADEVVGRSLSLLIPPGRPDELRSIRERVERSERIRDYETVRVGKDGRPIDVSVTVSPVRDAAGHIVAAASIVRDITAVKQAAEERERLAEAVDRERSTLATVMTSMSDGLLLVDADSRVRYCNRRAGELLGIDPSAAAGRPAEEIHAQISRDMADPSRLSDAWQHATANLHEHPTFDVTLAGPTARDLAVELFEVAPGEGSVGVILRDVTAERELQRAKDDLVSVVSHELRTPLASLVGFAELLLTREYAEPRRREYLSIIREEGHRLTGLINDFLDLQRMESGPQNLVPVPVSLRSLLQRVTANAGEDPERPIVLDVPEQLPMVRADGDRVLQVVGNLLSNARKYSPGGGEIVLSARQKEGLVEVSVSDQGLGLPPDAVPRLFEKFYRVDNSDHREIKGTGLGLAICRQIVTAHGGQIWAESAGVGRGSRFAFTLPLADAAGSHGDILIVEDEAGFARLLSAELASRGLSAVWTTRGEDALARLPEARPRAIILDLLLPDVPGEEVLRRLRQTNSDVPVVVLTVKDLTPREVRALQQRGVLGILRKAPDAAARAAGTIAHALDLSSDPEEEAEA